MTKVQHREMNMRVNEQSKMINHFLEKQVEENSGTFASLIYSASAKQIIIVLKTGRMEKIDIKDIKENGKVNLDILDVKLSQFNAIDVQDNQQSNYERISDTDNKPTDKPDKEFELTDLMSEKFYIDNAAYILGGMAIVGGAIAYKNNDDSSDFETPNSLIEPVSVLNGPIAGAKLYKYDKNGNLQELSDVKSSQSGYVDFDDITQLNVPLTEDDYIVAMDGVNANSGVSNNIVLEAPVGSSVLSPLTTLASYMMRSDSSLDMETVNKTIIDYLQLPKTDSFTVFDFNPFADTYENDDLVIAVEWQKAAASLAHILQGLPQNETMSDDNNKDSFDIDLKEFIAESATILTPEQIQEFIDNYNGIDKVKNSDINDSPFLQSEYLNALVSHMDKFPESGTLTSFSMISNLVSDEFSVEDILEYKKVVDSSINEIKNVSELAEIAIIQADYFDDIAPSAPLSMLIQNYTEWNGEAAFDLTVILPEVSNASGKAVVPGDILDVKNDDSVLITHTLTLEDIQSGFVSLPMNLLPGEYELVGYFSDESGNVSEASASKTLLVSETPLSVNSLSLDFDDDGEYEALYEWAKDDNFNAPLIGDNEANPTDVNLSIDISSAVEDEIIDIYADGILIASTGSLTNENINDGIFEWSHNELLMSLADADKNTITHDANDNNVKFDVKVTSGDALSESVQSGTWEYNW